MSLEFAMTWDYRCPFARNLHEHLVTALEGGADWDVEFWPFSLNQVHVAEGDPDVWDDPAKADGLLAMQVGIAVRDRFPESFLKVHVALFAARHDEGRDIREEKVLRDILTTNGVDADAVFAEVAGGGTLDTFRKAHERAVNEHHVFGVPTIITGDQAVFVRVMHRPKGDVEEATRTIERCVDLTTGWTDLNEFKHTSIPR